ncbi:SLEI domain protein, PF07620 family [Leptospira noguchii str. Bonito]|nr:SLEI domain protein, PF07620 family [Leptospira noguchii str. Bonito]
MASRIRPGFLMSNSRYLEFIPKSQRILYDHSLEIFNQMQ